MRLGNITITRTLYEYCGENNIDIQPFLNEYAAERWGDLGQDDIDANDNEIKEPAGHILGKYNLPTGEDIYIETSWNNEFRHTSVHFCNER